MKTLIIIVTALLFYSCADSDIKQKVRTESVTSPITIQYFKKNEMDYMVVYTGSYRGGVTIRNLTLDNIQIEFYKSNLKK